MKFRYGFTLVFLALLLTSCGNGGGTKTSATETPVPLSTPQESTSRAPSVEAAMTAFLESLRAEDYPAMYAMLTQASRDAITQEDFVKRYTDVMLTMNKVGLDYTIASVFTRPLTAQVAYDIQYHTAVLGDIERKNILANFILEDSEWHLLWSDGLILPDLEGGNRLVMECRIPARGNIYDIDGKPIATQSGAVALGLIPGQILEDQESYLLGLLSRLTGLRSDYIRSLYVNAQPDWYIPVGEISAEDYNTNKDNLNGLGGLVMNPYEARYYQKSGIAPQSVGYVQSIYAEELDDYRRIGYCGNERVGKAGIEKWAEEYLTGVHGATLYVTDANGNILTSLARTDSQPSQSLYLTLEKDFQYQAQQAFDGLPGAAVVIEVDTGRVLAMVSSPGFDPNLFEPTNYNSSSMLGELMADQNQPMFNRAAQGAYPLGSVFKIITMAAALESGVFTQYDTYDCQYAFTDLGTPILYDWTWDHCQTELAEEGECKTQPSGLLTLPEGLMRSCNPWFWHIGLELFNQGKGNLVTEMASAFGLGKTTGLQQVAESEGTLGEPANGLMATNIAIGQDPVLVTPLQVAVFTAALANGGTLYRPQIVESIQPVSGDPIQAFKSEVSGSLPVSAENLKIITDAMREVIVNERGTAVRRFRGLNIPVAGKTGTAESGIPGYPHAWFTGYTMQNDPDHPDIAIAVFVQNKGEGSDYAAPIFRRLVEIYFYGQPQTVYWFESTFGLLETETPAP